MKSVPLPSKKNLKDYCSAFLSPLMVKALECQDTSSFPQLPKVTKDTEFVTALWAAIAATVDARVEQLHRQLMETCGRVAAGSPEVQLETLSPVDEVD